MLKIVKDSSENIISLLENTGYFLINEQKKHEYKTYKKKDGSLLTELDIASEAIIKCELEGLFGNIKVLSEENSEQENQQIAGEKYCFLLDPIDGTQNFDKGKNFTINLAFCVNKIPTISFIHSPLQKTILFSDTNNAYKKTGGQIVKLNPITLLEKNKIDNKKDNINIAIGVHNFENKKFVNTIVTLIQQNGYNFSEKNLKAFSAMDKLLSFVNNEVDAFWSSSVCKDWDILPALPILRAINANFYTNNQTLFNNNNFDSGTFIVSKSEKLLNNLVDISEQTKNILS